MITIPLTYKSLAKVYMITIPLTYKSYGESVHDYYPVNI